MGRPGDYDFTLLFKDKGGRLPSAWLPDDRALCAVARPSAEVVKALEPLGDSWGQSSLFLQIPSQVWESVILRVQNSPLSERLLLAYVAEREGRNPQHALAICLGGGGRGVPRGNAGRFLVGNHHLPGNLKKGLVLGRHLSPCAEDPRDTRAALQFWGPVLQPSGSN